MSVRVHPWLNFMIPLFRPTQIMCMACGVRQDIPLSFSGKTDKALCSSRVCGGVITHHGVVKPPETVPTLPAARVDVPLTEQQLKDRECSRLSNLRAQAKRRDLRDRGLCVRCETPSLTALCDPCNPRKADPEKVVYVCIEKLIGVVAAHYGLTVPALKQLERRRGRIEQHDRRPQWAVYVVGRELGCTYAEITSAFKYEDGSPLRQSTVFVDVEKARDLARTNRAFAASLALLRQEARQVATKRQRTGWKCLGI